MSEQTYYEAVGRRKTASARVRLYPAGEETEFVVNGRPMTEYFPRLGDQIHLLEPLKALDMMERFNISVLVKGGGISGQAGAVRLGIARALVKYDESLRPALKKQGFLTRDARAKERKKPGLKRARKAPQYTKR
ncbi:MAG: 30S ribosomal protein S9 [Chloroflexi bacterium]|nr:30S ribosomal protein S9 [Chloroflexota bacterium]